MKMRLTTRPKTAEECRAADVLAAIYRNLIEMSTHGALKPVVYEDSQSPDRLMVAFALPKDFIEAHLPSRAFFTSLPREIVKRDKK